MAGTLTWLGHSAFRIDTLGGKRVYVDPFLNGNPKCPEDEVEPERVDAIFITHGHGDHYGDTVALAGKFGCTVVAPVELAGWLQAQGAESVLDVNKGGTVDLDGVKVTLTHAQHSSSTNGGTYAGEPCGSSSSSRTASRCTSPATRTSSATWRSSRGYTSRSWRCSRSAGTMGPSEAAVALELLGVERCVPCHWGTFGLLTGTPEELRALAPAGVEIVDVEPGGTVEL
jgi:L-ascorbate metabolism protein UlaG (beta-lactamase superfamily)